MHLLYIYLDGLAFDWVHNWLYFTDQVLDIVGAVDPVRSNYTILIKNWSQYKTSCNSGGSICWVMKITLESIGTVCHQCMQKQSNKLCSLASII